MGIFVTALTIAKICFQNTAVLSLYLNAQDSSVFYIDFVQDSTFKEI